MPTDLLRQRLRKFYADTFVKALRIGRTSTNIIVYFYIEGKRKVVGRFPLDAGVEIAEKLAGICKQAALDIVVDDEMDKLEDKKSEVGVIVNTVAPQETETVVCSPESEEIPDYSEVAEPTPINDPLPFQPPPEPVQQKPARKRKTPVEQPVLAHVQGNPLEEFLRSD